MVEANPNPTGNTGGLNGGGIDSAGGQNAADIAIAFCRAQVGKPYVWGAIGPNSYDCSGLLFTAYHHAGINLPRTSAAMQTAGSPIPCGQQLPGDIILPYPGHIFIYIGNNRIIEAPRPGLDVQYNNLYKCWKVRRVTTPGTGVGNLASSSSPMGLADIPGIGFSPAAAWATNDHNWYRIGMGLTGAALLGLGVWEITH